jgi:hypothetical protein
VGDDYDFHPGQPGADGALALQWYSGAKPFRTEAQCVSRYAPTVRYRDRHLFHPVC